MIMTKARFAPSPTGLLHIGHAYSALFAYARGEHFILRIEDIDTERCSAEFEDAIFEDLTWLGLKWDSPVLRQSENMVAYKDALTRLDEMGVIYPCICSRKDIRQSTSAPHSPEGQIYPETCRDKTISEVKSSGKPYALRLNIDKALPFLPKDLSFTDVTHGTLKVKPYLLGDAVLARKFVETSYHLSVCVDDAAQGITHVTRGEELLYTTHIHRIIQSLLGFPEPSYEHHKIILDEHGERFAKRNHSISLRALRKNGISADALKEKYCGDI